MKSDISQWPTRPYERPITPVPLTPIEAQVLQLTKEWAHQAERPLHHEPRLTHAVSLIRKHSDFNSLDLGVARLYCRYLGLSDGLIAASLLDLHSTEPLRETVTTFLSRQFPTLFYNRVGLQILPTTTGFRILFLFSKKDLALAPIPSRLSSNQAIHLRGQLLAPITELKRATLVFSTPDGSIKRRVLEVHDGHFTTLLTTGTLPGILDVQLLLDQGHGPEISSQFAIGVERSPFKMTPASQPILKPNSNHPSSSAALERLLTRHRTEKSLHPLIRSAALDQIATAHSEDMLNNQFFGHVSDRSGSVMDRLHSKGITFERVLENIATGDSAESVFQQWLDSPSHRQNLLDPFITSFGLGVVTDTRAPHTPLTVVLILTRLGEEGTDDQLKSKAYQLLHQSRVQTDAPPLRANPKLEALAMAHSQTMGSRKILDTNHPYFGNLLDRIMQETTFNQSAADIYLTTNLESLTTSAHLSDVFEEVGVGVYRDLSQKNTPIWVTVIYATP